MLSESVLSLDFEFIYHIFDQPLSYAFPVLLLLLALFSASRRHGPQSTIPIYESGNGSKERAKKMWMLDAMNVLREGYEEVSDIPKPICKSSQKANNPFSSSKTSTSKSGQQKETW